MAFSLRPQLKSGWHWLPVATFLYLLLAVLLSPQLIYSGKFSNDPDGYLRAQQVRTFIETGDWFNTREVRLDPPFGVEVFSRLVDLPLAAIAAPLIHAMPLDQAMLIAAFIVPFLIMLPLLLLIAHWAFRPLLGREWAWVSSPIIAFSICITPEFMPGRIDHHNWQILLALLAFGTTLRLLLTSAKASGWLGFLMAFIAATAFAVGVEALPIMLLLFGCIGLKLLLDPQPIRKAVIILGLFLPTLMFDYMYLLRAPTRWYDPTLIAPSMVWVKLTAAIGLVFILSALIAPRVRHRTLRFIFMYLIAAVAAAALYANMPNLFVQNVFLGFEDWYADFTRMYVSEQQALYWQPFIWQGIAFSTILSYIGYSLAMRHDPARKWIYRLLAALLVLSFIILLAYARRFARFWPIFEIPGMVLCLMYSLRYLQSRYPLSRWRTGAEILLVLVCIPFAHSWLSIGLANGATARLATEVVTFNNPEKCDVSEAAKFLAAQYPQPKVILTADTIGPQLIYNTPHLVIGGGIYNNAMGVTVTDKFFAGTELDAKNAARLHGIDLVYICKGKSILSMFENIAAKDQGAPLWFKRDQLPDWLKPVDLPYSQDDLLLEVIQPITPN